MRPLAGAESLIPGFFARSQSMAAVLFSIAMVGSTLGIPGPSGSPGASPPPLPASNGYTAFPSTDPDDGKFMAVAGEGMSTLAGIAVIAFIGVPAGSASFEVGIFDGDTTNHWDLEGPGSTLNYRLYRDPLKNGATGSLLAQWTSDNALDDAWYTRAFNVDDGAKAPSGNYFYRLEANWANPNSQSFNNFKIRTTGQISLRAGQEFGFAGGPQDFSVDPCVGSGDPNPGDTNDPDANSYNGDWPWYFYVPTVLTSIAFRDGDSDRVDDENSPGRPQDGPSGNGACADVPPSIYYTVTDPADHVFTNNNPSGDQEWEDFTIGPSPGDDITINYPLQPGLWQLRVRGMDAHNFNVMRANFEVYSTPDPPLTVNPTPVLEPDHELTSGDGVTLEYAHTVTNEGSRDSFDLRSASAHGWTTRIYGDLNGNGTVDPGESQVSMTPYLDQGQSYAIVVQVDVPGGLPNTDDVTTVLASSRSEWAVQDDALDTTHVRVNEEPTADVGGPYVGVEGTPIAFNGDGSSDPDGDPLTYRWDFQADGTWDTAWSSNPTASYTWGDDWTGTACLEVSDGNLTDTECVAVAVNNVAPTIEFTTIPTGDEAQSLQFQVRVTDPGSDDVSVGWWGPCQGWTPALLYPNDPANVPDPDPSPDVHPRDVTDVQTVVCGDDGAYDWNVRIEDDDGGVTTAGGTFSVDNLPPSFTVSPPSQLSVDEGTLVSLDATVEDPGSDDLAFAWSWQYGPTETRTYYNDGTGPDPPNSPDGTYPFTASDSSSHTYGDDGQYVVTLVVHDDDGGSLTYTTTVDVANVAPTVDAGADGATDEGSSIAFTFAFTDPGFDQPAAGTVEDFTATVGWGDGTSEALAVTEVPGGPGVPTTGTMAAAHIFADNGLYTVTVTVCDDDGGCGSDALAVAVANVAPTVDAGPDVATDEATALSFAFSFSDPGFDFPPAGTVEDFTATVDWGYGAPDAPAVAEVPGGPGVPTTGTISVSHTYGDNGAFTVTVTVCDDDGGCGSDSLVVRVDNVDPAILDVQAYVVADLRLRVAGEKWHDVRMDLVWNGGVTGTARVVRYPGSPDDQSATIEGGRLQLLGDFAITLYYTPDDDPVNGNRNGANPAWVILTMPDGSEVRLHHTFNVQHPATWTWTIDDLRPYILGQEITFEATASDVGSDDLTFAWDFGDSATASATYFNNGVGPDPFPSPEVNPITATDMRTHAFGAVGTYTISLTVTDDDGGAVSVSFTLSVGG